MRELGSILRKDIVVVFDELLCDAADIGHGDQLNPTQADNESEQSTITYT
jgi:hypothetical protein